MPEIYAPTLQMQNTVSFGIVGQQPEESRTHNP